MAMFGALASKKPFDTGNVGGYSGLQQPLPAPPEQSGGFFGQGGVGRGIAGNIGDFLLQYAGAQPIYAPQMQRQQAMKQQQQAGEANRLEEERQWIAREQYKRANTPPETFESNSGDRYTIGADGTPRLIFKDPTPKTEWINVKNPDGTMTIMPKPVGGGNAPPSTLPADFDFGGQTPPASGRFP